MFFNPSDFPFTKILEENWKPILKEYKEIPREKIRLWHEKHLYQKEWGVFGLYGFGKKIPENCKLCPETARLVEQIPNLFMAGFSILGP